MSILAVGIGNLERGDDGAGIQVTRRLRRTRTTELGTCVRLMDVWEGENEVVVIDAMRSGRPPGTVVRLNASSDRLPWGLFASTHGFGLAETVELARKLDRLPPSLTIYGIEVEELGHGTGLTKEVEQAVAAVAEEIDAGSRQCV